MVREYNQMAAGGATLEELEKLTLGSLRRTVFDGDLESGSFMAGQAAGMIRKIKPVKVIIEELFSGINEYKNRLEVI